MEDWGISAVPAGTVQHALFLETAALIKVDASGVHRLDSALACSPETLRHAAYCWEAQQYQARAHEGP